ncbi:lanthionine synthetase [Catellatospora sp. IY07-71]|uniref:type 2 lanthipeptide synthetase LanM family protein n=1 Tax=Catellatospora sp. IY07-71 TaxID=2728827 RepID=UPI001BB3AC36|nr:type 2 lanthipeptide synthetase LanM family protein [Catellatospora sp. IY07-71]BCJ76938.1 lanthionine synthetase [Catellatospora sp. IY07-71]
MALHAALNLRERLALPAPGTGGAASDRARWRLTRWRELDAFTGTALWTERLAADRLDEPALLRLLDDTPDDLRHRAGGDPGWITALRRRYAGPGADLPIEAATDRPMAAAAVVAAPLVAHATRQVTEHARRLAAATPGAPFDPDTVAAATVPGLLDELVVQLSRAAVLELNIARLHEQQAPAGPAERFHTFFARLREPAAALAFLTAYPVLARQVLGTADRWAARTCELLDRLAADAALLRHTFTGGAPLGVLTAADETGDPHHGGRRVLLARFSGGVTIVYKPRDVTVEARYADLVDWLNERGADLRACAVVPRAGYGWAEFVPADTSTGDAAAYARRRGGLLALLYALGATDFHDENLVTHGGHPVPIDLETLFTPAVTERRSAVADSVLGVGALPTGDAVAAGRACGCTRWVGVGTDLMRLELAPAHSHAVAGPGVDLAAYTEDVVHGFRVTYALLRAARGVLAADDGPLAAFAADEIRVVLRPTRTYRRLAEAALHTDHLRDGLDRDRLLDWLWSGVAQLPPLRDFVAAERSDLDAGDVPRFTARAGATSLGTGTGDPVPDVLVRSGLAEARRRLRGLGDTDLARQVWLIRAAYAAQADGAGAPHAAVRWQLPDLAVQLGEPAREDTPESALPKVRRRALDAAAAIGDRIVELSDHDGWFALTPAGIGWRVGRAADHLYDGTAGIALFLAWLGAQTGEGRFADAADRAAGRLATRIAQRAVAGTSIGAFTGWSGLSYCYGHLAALGHRSAHTTADLIITRLDALVGTGTVLDVVDGAAGCVLALLSAGHDTDRVLPLASRAADLLLQPPPGGPRLGGFSHGTAGQAAALAAMWHATGQQRYLDGALAALQHDRSLFDPARGNWADLREPGRFSLTWCHGAPGVGLSRLRIRAALGIHPDSAPSVPAGTPDGEHDRLTAEIATAVRTTLAGGFGRNHSLCHGDLGNLDLLLAAGEPDRTVAAVAAAILDDGRTYGWRAANPTGHPSPELMTGLSGVGYGLLRLAAPETVPALLMLAPPAPTTTWSKP